MVANSSIRALLTATPSTVIYSNSQQRQVYCAAINFCNTDTVKVKVTFGIRNTADILLPIQYGAILYDVELEPSQTLEISDRVLQQNDFIFASANVADKVSLFTNIQIIDDIQYTQTNN